MLMRVSMRLFRKFQWQLSLSYTLVAVGSLLVVELLLIVGMLVLFGSDTLPRMLTASFREQFSANLRPFLDGPTPDREGLRRFMSAYGNLGMTPAPAEIAPHDQAPDLQFWTVEDASQNLVVVSAEGEVLWAQFSGPGIRAGAALETASIPGVEQVLPAALANERETKKLYTNRGSFLVLAVPVEDASRQRALGAIVMLLDMPSVTNPRFLRQLLPTVLVSGGVFTLFAGLVGSVFGFFTARGLTRRLERVSRASDAWSRGDFSTSINDRAGDELGALAQRLNVMAEQLRNLLNTRQELAALEERNRIARELHDSVKQQVFATAMQLGAARALLSEEAASGPAGQRLAEAERLTQQAQNELNALIHHLRPVALEGKGLARALRELSEDWSRQTGITTRVEINGSADGLPAAAGNTAELARGQALYRIAQEALANAARHSRANSVQITLTPADGRTRLTITDDGAGFDPGSAPDGIGLHSMRERVEALGGTFDLQSAPGSGTRLTVEM